jgi:hypothetical protein
VMKRRAFLLKIAIFMLGGALRGMGDSPVNRILPPLIHEIYDFHPLPCLATVTTIFSHITGAFDRGRNRVTRLAWCQKDHKLAASGA